MTGFPIAKGGALVNTSRSFEQFFGDLQSGRVVLNIHTNRNADGEISGDLLPAT